MKSLDFSKIPTFDQLPVQKGAPPDSAWGVFGDRDELGCLNFLTPEGLVDAARLVQSGQVFRLDTKVGFAKPPLFGRAKVVHRIVPLGPLANDDLFDNYNTQEGSQWDGLAHVGHIRYERFYGGVKREEIQDGPGGRLSIHHWSGRFAGRGVLIDAYGFRKSRGIAVNPMEPGEFTLAELEAALAAQGTTLKPGSILLVRTGWMEAYEALPPEGKARMEKFENIKSIGVERSRAMAAWLWNQRVAAIGTDNPAVESLPFDLADENALHYRALPLLGLPLGELFVLAPLAEDCARDGRYEFLVTSAPMNVEGGIASPPNALAIK
jgi:kynurenine formamidase